MGTGGARPIENQITACGERKPNPREDKPRKPAISLRLQTRHFASSAGARGLGAMHQYPRGQKALLGNVLHSQLARSSDPDHPKL
jgi:hypothetical protein